MQQGMQRADLEGRPIYLEADSDNVAGFYERLGFEVIDEMTIRGIDLRFSLMLRRPGTARSPSFSEESTSRSSTARSTRRRNCPGGTSRASVTR